MISSDQETALLVFQQALDCLETLFVAVAAREVSFVHRWQGLLASGQQIDPRDVGLGNRGTLGDLILSAENGHRVTKSQQAWVNACFEYAAGVAGVAASYLWIYDRLIVKEKFAIGRKWEPEIRIITCSRCGVSWVERKEIERTAATVWANFRVRALIEAGRGKEAADEALGCSECSTFIAAVEEILKQANIKRVENGLEGCPECESGQIRYSLLKIDWDAARQAVQKRVV